MIFEKKKTKKSNFSRNDKRIRRRKAQRDKTDDKENESELDIIFEHYQEKLDIIICFGYF
jgi:hypothetical protein